MKHKIVGSSLLLGVLTFLFLFPLFAHFLGERGGVVRIEKEGIEPWFLEDEKAPVVLLYFGYVGCTTICIPTLNEFTPLYQKIKSRYPQTPFYFVNLNPTQPSEWVEPFAKSFHPDFHGIYATTEQTDRLERDFNLAVSEGEEMAHSSHLYLMVLEDDRHYVLKRIYTTHPYPQKAILEDIERFG